MRKLQVEITYKYQLKIDDTDDIVKEYQDDDELIHDCVYNFGSVLPVIAVGAVKIIDRELEDFSII